MLLTWVNTPASPRRPITKRALVQVVSQDETGDGEGYGKEDAEKGEDGFFRPAGCGRGLRVQHGIYTDK